jgi:hypothetical protein
MAIPFVQYIQGNPSGGVDPYSIAISAAANVQNEREEQMRAATQLAIAQMEAQTRMMQIQAQMQIAARQDALEQQRLQQQAALAKQEMAMNAPQKEAERQLTLAQTELTLAQIAKAQMAPFAIDEKLKAIQAAGASIPPSAGPPGSPSFLQEVERTFQRVSQWASENAKADAFLKSLSASKTNLAIPTNDGKEVKVETTVYSSPFLGRALKQEEVGALTSGLLDFSDFKSWLQKGAPAFKDAVGKLLPGVAKLPDGQIPEETRRKLDSLVDKSFLSDLQTIAPSKDVSSVVKSLPTPEQRLAYLVKASGTEVSATRAAGAPDVGSSFAGGVVTSVGPAKTGGTVSETASKWYSYLKRMESANSILNSMEMSGKFNPAQLINAVQLSGAVPEAIMSEDAKKYLSAAKAFVTGVVYRDSGAAITAAEFDRALTTYFPSAGDTPTVIAQKRALRERDIQSMREVLSKTFPGFDEVSAGSSTGQPIVGGDTDASQYKIHRGVPPASLMSQFRKGTVTYGGKRVSAYINPQTGDVYLIGF